MVKILITAQEVREARKEGRREIVVPPGALITPQARDDAGEFGIRLATEAGPAQGPSHAAALVPPAPSAPSALPKPALAGGGVPGRITLYAGKPFEEASARA